MDTTIHIPANEYRADKAELKNAKLLYFLMSVLLVADWVMPQYFGVHIAFDFTATRILNMLLLVYFVFNRSAGNHFLRSMLDVQMTPYLALYMAVMIYTTVLRINVNTFFLNFLDILTFYMVYYGIRYVIGVRRSIDWTVRIAWFFGIYGLVEYVLGFSPMIKYLMTLPNDAKIIYRSGQYRIMGPCVHSIAYGMFLLMFLAIICIDYEKDEIDLLRHPVLYVILMVNIFLTGSRGPLGFAILETVLLLALCKSEKRKKTIFILIVMMFALILIEVAMIGTPIGRYIMMQITSIIDEVLGTDFSAYFGADTTLLEQSSSYRDMLPRIFTVKWLNPLLGRGVNASVGFEFDGAYVQSIDNYYVALYIRYAYPGLIAFVLFEITTLFFMVRTWIQKHSGLAMALAIGLVIYFINLWWVDYLQTTKYMYILLAIYAAYYSEQFLGDDTREQEIRRWGTSALR
jgi:hypothetical protein